MKKTLFVENIENPPGVCRISPTVAAEIGATDGSQVKITDGDTNKSVNCTLVVDSNLLDISMQVSKDLLTSIDFSGIELSVEPAAGGSLPPASAPAMPAPSAPPAMPAPSAPPAMPAPSAPPATPAPSAPPAMPAPSAPPATPAPSVPPAMPAPSAPPATPAPSVPPAMPAPSAPPAMPAPSAPPAMPAPSAPPAMPGAPSMPGMPTIPGSVPPSSIPGSVPPSGMPGMPGMPSMPGMGMPGAPSMPGMGMPGMPSMPGTGMPGAPSMPGMGMPGMPGMPGMDGMPGMPGMPGMETPEFAPPPDPYPNRIDVFTLASQKTPSKVVNPIIQSVPPGTIILSQNTVNTLGIWPNALAGWECPLTRSQGSARIKVGSVLDDQIGMSEQTKEDTNIKSDQVVVYSLEPPLVHQEAISLEVESKPDMNGFIQVSYRNAMSLQVTNGEIIAFEDSLTGASGAGKANISETVPDNKVFIDAELMESCGVNSYEVDLKKNLRQIIPLQSIELGIAPIKGENVWEVISMAKQNINSIKQWLGNYPIFKGIKLRWHAANVACEVLNTVPNLEGDVLASISPSTSLTLKPLGLVTFNAILVIDISRSMMARDVEVKNIGPALEGIKAAMHADEIQDFLKSFKPGTNVTRRHSAAFAGVLFLSEKVGRGFGEKVSIIRFADDAEVLKFPPNFLPYMDASSGEKGILEDCAKRIVNDIALAYGQATNMGKAMVKAEEVLAMYGNEQPTMIILLTDGAATDGDEFMKSISRISKNPNVVMYIIGLGNPDKETMKKAAYLLSGEYYEPADSGELLIWYSKRARDLQVKLKGQGSDA